MNFSNHTKLAMVTPIYRPISILPTFSKIIEKLMFTEFLDKKNSISFKKQTNKQINYTGST